MKGTFLKVRKICISVFTKTLLYSDIWMRGDGKNE